MGVTAVLFIGESIIESLEGDAKCYLRHRIQTISWSLLLLLANLYNFETEKQINTNLYFGVLASDTVQSGKVPTNVSGDTVTTTKTPSSHQVCHWQICAQKRNPGVFCFYFPDHVSIVWAFLLPAVFRCDNGLWVQSILAIFMITQAPSCHGHVTNFNRL